MNQSIIEHKANMYYVEFREDFLLLCKNCGYTKLTKDGKKSKASPYCKALILSILECWTNEKRGKGDGLFVYMSYQQWNDAMYGMFGRNVIIDSLDELKGEGLIARESYKMFGRDTFQYLLNHTEVNKRMRCLEDKSPDILHPHPFTSKRVETPQESSTHLLVNGSGRKVNASRLQVNDDPFTSNYNIESNLDSTQHHTETNTHIALVSDDASERISQVSSEDENARHPGGDIPQPTENTTHPIARVSTSKKKTSDAKQMEIGMPPAMPPQDAAWHSETAVQIVEARKGRTYSEKTRNSEKENARKVLAIQIQGERITRAQFEQAWTSMEAWDVWKKGTEPMIRHLLKDDRIASLIKPGARPAQTQPRVVDMVEWQGRKMPKDEARKHGYTGFEKYVGNSPEERAAWTTQIESDPELMRLFKEMA